MRYRTDDLPPAGVGAFMPIPASDPVASSWGLVHVVGAPGTMAIDVPDPDESIPPVSARGGINSARPSDASPDVIFPSVYYTRIANLGPEAGIGLGLTKRRFNELPVPAVNPTRIPIVAGTYKPAKLGGRLAMLWPRAFQRFNRGD
jgi:hypothetical protein